MGEALQKLREVLLPIEVVAAFRRVVQIPGYFIQILEGCEEVGRLAQRRDEALDHLISCEALHCVDGGREACCQEK